MEWTSELEDTLKKIDSRAFALINTHWVPVLYKGDSKKDGLWDVINIGEKKNIISPGSTILDMGSGSGTSVLLWDYRGYDAVGIELNQDLVDISIESITNAEKKIPIYHGSYFPDDYIQLRNSGQSHAVQYELDLLGEVRFDVFHPTAKNWEEISNSLNFEDIDIFYKYSWQIQSPSVVEIFSRYSRKDSVLCLIGHVETELLEELNLRQIENSDYIVHRENS